MTKPKFETMWGNFARINVSVKEVGNRIGGKVQYNIDQGIFQNACAIRMSYTLNYSGIPIKPNPRWDTSSGADKKMVYIQNLSSYRIFEIHSWQSRYYSKIKSRYECLTGEKGLVVFNVSWSDATGHATLWDGSRCSDKCYYESVS